MELSMFGGLNLGEVADAVIEAENSMLSAVDLLRYGVFVVSRRWALSGRARAL
jgi:hypothetical protein